EQATPAASAWDDADELPFEATTPAAKMPVWDAPPPINAPAAEEPEWGFDEAQIEAARGSMPAAAVPKLHNEKERPGRFGLLVALMVIAIVAGAGYFGFLWWQGREDAAVPAVAESTPAPVTTSASPVTTTTAPDTMVDLAPPMTITAAPAPATTTITAPPPVATAATASVEPSPTQALPRVTARTPVTTPAASTPGRERLDAMARQYASNPSGNFTVQIQILCDAGNLDKLTRTGGENVWFVPQPIGERSCYRVFWGRYSTREQAQQALAQIPAGVRDRNSAVKAVPKG
ncbi:MAG TPA: SPOR domain-containing protein, partial [Thermoanaerobaculia bacterium]|nr:SPOR domain-containing protein [Thermoanaerobaculia bacterium]